MSTNSSVSNILWSIIVTATLLIKQTVSTQTTYYYNNINSNYFIGSDVEIHNNFTMIGSRSDSSVYILQYNGQNSNTWNQTQIIFSNTSSRTYFGSPIDISNNFLIVGAFLDDENNLGYNTGSAFIYQYNKTTNLWNEIVKLKPSSIDNDTTYSYFGYSVGISGNFCIMGTLRNYVFIYQYDNMSNWQLIQTLIMYVLLKQII